MDTRNDVLNLKKINKQQQAALAQFQNLQTKFSEQYKLSLSDEIETQLIKLIETESPFKDSLQNYDAPSALRLTILEMTMGPILQLMEIKGVGAALVFAERVLALKKKELNYINLFHSQISKVNDHDDEDIISLQISLANLANIFSQNYFLFKIHSVKNSLDLLDKNRRNKLLQDIIIYVDSLIKKIILIITVKNPDLNLKKVKENFLSEEKLISPQERWKDEFDKQKQLEEDSLLAKSYIYENFLTIEENLKDLLNFDHSELTESKYLNAVDEWLNRARDILYIFNVLSFCIYG